VAMIRASQRVGLSIEEIREALSALPPRQVPTPRDWERLAGHLRHVVSQRIDDLFDVLDELTQRRPSGSPIPPSLDGHGNRRPGRSRAGTR
jgi:MerR family transcriptional regulator, redox-sensitive transcriptional activator SoxR